MAEKDEKNDKKETLEEPKEETVVTKGSIKIGTEEVKYTATTGTMILRQEDPKKKEEGLKPKAKIFYIAYTREGVDDFSERPITFSFNGGPGSSSVWLHLGLLGPKRVIAEKDGKPVPPPYRLVPNEHSILDVSDLVFIDPVSTGYSRAVKGENPEQFHDYNKDIESVAEFIRLYTSRNQRWSSPKFLIGESYGTTRAGGLSGYLQDRYGMYLNGLMLVSSILNFQTARFMPGNDLPFLLFLPTYAATAWYHKKLKEELLQADLKVTLSKVEEFVMKDYVLALMKGDKLSPREKSRIIKKLSDFTGLSKDYIDRTNLRINIHRFTNELLRNERRIVGRLDSRFVGIDRDAAGEMNTYDPSYAAIQGPYTATFNDYVRKELNYANDENYEILANLWMTWKYEKFQNQFLNVAETLRDAMSKNPFLKVFVANGYYDLATPYFATEYTFDHMGLDPSLQGNIKMEYYEAGHMMYMHPPSLEKLSKDLRTFISWAIP